MSLIRIAVMTLLSILAVESQTITTDVLPAAFTGSSSISSLPSSTSLSSSSFSSSTSTASTTSSSSTTSTASMSSSTISAPSSSPSSSPSNSPSSSPSNSPSSSSSSSPSSSSSSSATMSSSAMAGSSSSSSVMPSSSTAAAAMSTTARVIPPKAYPTNNPDYARVVAAVVGGCGLFLLNTIFFIVVSVLLRYTVRMERHKMPRTGRKSLTGGGVNFYGGLEVQSAQALFAPSLSATNIVSGASDIQLDTRAGRGLYVNQGFDSGPSSSSAAMSLDSGSNANLYKPIEIRKSYGGDSKV